jgi:hypothetical protein
MISVQALEALIGQPENADFDCKEWHARADAARGSIAKAACGFANATGGVIVIGLKASGRGADTPDVVQGLAPVADRETVASEALDIILKFVEPGIEGIEIRTIPAAKTGPSGFVLVFVPASEGAPRRSKMDWKFYVRISSGTIPMEFFQVEERFGRRPLSRLSLYIEPQGMIAASGFLRSPLRQLLFGLKNEGRGIAKFPGVRFKRSANLQQDGYGIDGNGGFGLPPRASEPDWIVFRGGVDDVIYPGETRLIGKLIQTAKDNGDTVRPLIAGQVRLRSMISERLWLCEAMTLQYEISADGTATLSGVCQLAEDALTLRGEIS